MLNTSNQQNCIVVSGLQKSYGSLKAVNGIDFTVKKGEIFGLLGPNGAGKSTTVEILAGLRQRDGGQVTVLGMDPVADSSKVKSRIGMQLQSASLYPRLKVAEILRLFASFYRRPLPPTEVLKRVNLEDKAGSLTSTLSGGQSQRLSVAIAMIGDGELLFLDEPTTGLDPQARRLLWEVIATLKQKGKTVVLTTHYMEEAEYLCDRVAVIDYGRIIALGSPPELIASHFQEQAIEFDAPGLSGGDELHLLDAVKRVESNGDTVTLYTTDAIRTMEAVLAVAATRGMEVQNFTVRRATLEDLFLKLTGRRIRE